MMDRKKRGRGAGGQGGRSGGAVRAMIAVLAVTAPLPRGPAAPLEAQTSLTIYNDGRVLVRRAVEVAVPKGTSTQRVALGTADPASLFTLDCAVAISGGA